MKFEFATAGRIIFGTGAANSIGEQATRLGRHAFVLTGAARHRSYRWGFGPPTRPPDDRRHCRGGSVVLAGKGR